MKKVQTQEVARKYCMIAENLFYQRVILDVLILELLTFKIETCFIQNQCATIRRNTCLPISQHWDTQTAASVIGPQSPTECENSSATKPSTLTWGKISI